MGTNSEDLRQLIEKLVSINAKSPGWNGMNARNSAAVPGGSSATDIVNKLRLSAIHYAKLISSGAALDSVKTEEQNIKGYLYTLAVFEQLDSESVDTLTDDLHSITDSYAASVSQ